VNFEFIRGEGSGVYYFIECNPRFSGGIAFTELAGVRMVRAHLAVFDGAGLSGLAEPQTGYMTRKYQEIRM
jgi:carbamoyl-phosphate synthase large subunit